jgi:CBS domain-containing protein
MRASDLMTRKVYTTSPQASVQEVVRLLHRQRISGVPVIDHDGQLVGMITEADILENSDCDDAIVAEIMSRQLTTVEEDTPIDEIAALLAGRHIKRVPVVREGHVVGIVSRADIVQAVAMGELLVRPW